MEMYMSDKFNIPVANLTKENVREELHKRGAAPGRPGIHVREEPAGGYPRDSEPCGRSGGAVQLRRVRAVPGGNGEHGGDAGAAESAAIPGVRVRQRDGVLLPAEPVLRS